MIRGIDSQVMINKTVDYSRQLSNQMQDLEHNKEFASQLQKSKVELQNQSVNETKEMEDRRVNGQDNAEDDGRGRKRKRKKGQVAEEAREQESERMLIEEEVMSRVPRRLSRNERSLGGSIDINI